MSNFSISDFKNLPYNPLVDGQILAIYPVLKEICGEDYKGIKQIDAYLRYTILLCEPSSSLVVSERDLTYRKTIAKDLAGFTFKTEEQEQDLYSYKDEIALELAVGYLQRFCKSKEFAALMAFENCYQESIRLLLKPIEEKVAGVSIKDKEILDAVQKKSAIKNEISSDLSRIKSLQEEFFGEDREMTKKALGRLTSENIRERRGKK